MKNFFKIIIFASLASSILTQAPSCAYKNSPEDNLYTCTLTFGSIPPDDIDKDIEGKTDDVPFEDVHKLVAAGMVTEFILVPIFRKFVNLQKLEFDFGVLENITSEFLFNCDKLQKIKIRDSIFTKVPPNTFSNCKAISEIDLGSNTIELLDKDTFKELEMLKILRLNSNKLLNVPASVFYPLVSLETLDLSGNSLKSFDAKIFMNNKQLRELIIANNKFSRIPKEYFDGLTQLAILDVTKSEVDAIERAMFDRLEGLNVAKFKENVCIDQDFENFKTEDVAELKKCTDNFNGGSILILSHLALVLTTFLILL